MNEDAALRARAPMEVLDDHLTLAAEHRFEEDIERNTSPDCVILERRGAFRGREGAHELARLLREELGDAPYTYVNTLLIDRFAFLEWTSEGSDVRVRDGADGLEVTARPPR